MVLRGGDICAPSQSIRGDHWIEKRRRAFQTEEAACAKVESMVSALELKLHRRRTQEEAGEAGPYALGCLCSKCVLKEPVDATERTGTGQG